MPRVPVSFVVADLSAFARSLERSLAAREPSAPPGHVEMLQLIARAAGHRNLQALRAAAATTAPAAAPQTHADSPSLSANARKALQQFDPEGRLVRWPSKFSVQRLALWILWTRFDPRRSYSEKDVNEVLKAANAFGDHVTLRRELIDHRLLARASDGSEYRKLPAHPDAETQALLSAWRARQRARA